MATLMENANRMATSKTAIKTAVNTDFDIINSEKIDQYASKITELENEYKKYIPINTSSGTESASVDNTNNDILLRSININGKSEQNSYSGKNFANKSLIQVQHSLNDDGSLSNSSARLAMFKLPVIPNTTYNVHIFNDYKFGKIFYYDVNGNFLSILETGSWLDNLSFTTANNVNYISFAMKRNDNANTSNSDKDNIQLQIEQGSTATAYEPYVGGAPAPSPDYPQEITSITGDVEITGKNLIHFDNINNGSNYGVSYTVNNSTITFNGTTNNAGRIIPVTPLGIVLPAGTYTFSVQFNGGTYTTSGSTTAIYIRGAGLTYAFDHDPTVDKFTKTLTQDTEISLEVYNNGANQVFNNLVVEMQIEQNNVSTTYEPYKSVTIPLSTTELCKVGDISDKLVVNSVTGEVSKIKNIRHLSFPISDMNNNNAWPGWRDTVVTNILYNDYPKKAGGFNVFGINNMSNITPLNYSGIALNTRDAKILYLEKSYFNSMSQDDWKTNYPNLILELYYQLATPTTEVITTLSQADLNKLKLITGTNTYNINKDTPITLNYWQKAS